MRVKTLLFSLFFFNSFFAAAQERWEYIDTTQLIPWDTFELEVGFDFCDLRIELFGDSEWKKLPRGARHVELRISILELRVSNHQQQL